MNTPRAKTSRPELSARGRRLLATPPMPEYFQAHSARQDAPYCAESNPNGYIPMSVAENDLVGHLLLERMADVEVPKDVLGYGPMIGSLDFRQKLAHFLGRRVFGRRFAPEQIAVLAGAGSVLEMLFHNLCDPGDAVLVPTPSYAGFWADLETRDEVQILPVHTESREGFRLTAEALDRVLHEAEVPVKALLFTSPNNPLGQVYSADDVAEVIVWAEAAGVHLVLDEIYALSVFGDREFTSGAQLRDSLGDFVHLVWAFSKDFGASGLRCGLLVSENEELLQAIDALAYWACASGHTQHLLGEIISDDAWVDRYIDQMRSGLRESHRRVTETLDEEGIPYLPSDAGFFFLCDLRKSLAEPRHRAERDLWRHILETTNVNLTPGAACEIAEPGFFRLCFASVPAEVAELGARRLGKALRSHASSQV